MSKDLKTVKTVFFNSEGTVKTPFMLAPHVAEHILGGIVDLLTQKQYSSINWTGEGLEVSAEVTNSDFTMVKKLNGVTSNYRLTFENSASFMRELVGVLSVLRFYPNIECIRYQVVTFMNQEFAGCLCADMDGRKMEMIVLNYYYNNLEYFPLPPHHVCVGDILQRSMGEI